jgi:hypothetical protein
VGTGQAGCPKLEGEIKMAEEEFDMDEIHIAIPGSYKGYTPIAIVSVPGFDELQARTTILGHNHESELPYAVFAFDVTKEGKRELHRSKQTGVVGEFFFTHDEASNGDVVETFWGWAPGYEIEKMTGFERQGFNEVD